MAQDTRPNILYIYVDDMGWGSIGPNGQTQRKADGQAYVRTPNINRLAEQGINFVRGYGCHVCSPARSSQQLGMHQGHTFADRNDPDNAKKAMRRNDITMGETLKSAGYATGYWGKWGYGGSKDQKDPKILNVQTLPTSHGYQDVLAELHHVRAHTFFQPTLWKAPANEGALGGLELVSNSMKNYSNKSEYPNTPAFQDHADYPTTAYCDDAYAFAALDFVRDKAQKYNETGQRFFGLLAVQVPHAPFAEISTLPEWNKVYADDPQFSSLAPQAQQWAAMVTRIDSHIGNLLAALEDPNGDGDKSDSVANNTLVIFQSDNGGPGGKNNIQLDANGGLSGVKGKIQEGGIRVPLVMRWPEKINASSKLKAGTNSEMIVDITDLLPTFSDLGSSNIRHIGLDGVSIAPTLLGKGHQRKREFIIHEASNGQSIIRGNHKLVRSKKSPLTLFDLGSDPTESKDISADHPELVKELETLLLGERVAEPKGFANTYHSWTGKNNASLSEADNWSDYEYANAGISYITDSGSPKNSWIASISTSKMGSATAIADNDVDFLGLAISTGHKGARQELVVKPGVSITGRNEVRVAEFATLTLNDGSVNSHRWLDIESGGTLSGTGNVNAILFNAGHIKVIDPKSQIKVNSEFHQSERATLTVGINGKESLALVVAKTANVAGVLVVDTTNQPSRKPGETHQVLTAEKVTGKFNNQNDEFKTREGRKFKISYSETAITITEKE